MDPALRDGLVCSEAEEVDDDTVRDEEEEGEDLDAGENGIFPDDLDKRRCDNADDTDIEEIPN